MKKLLVWLACGALFSSVPFAAGRADRQEEKQVMATLDRVAQATVKKDVATLSKIYHDDLTFEKVDQILLELKKRP